MTLSKKQSNEFHTFIFSWWEIHKRDLPWRHTHDPYKILVSEVMLQQTQVARVLPKYTEFIKTFPTVQSLASAKTADILRLWKGMGYNRRALYLHKTAKIISSKYDNQFPVSEQQISQLPGIGTYTSRAIMVFAYQKDVAMVDTNIRQIITHFFFHDKTQSEKVIQDVADQLVPQGKSWDWHQALMDYGALQLHLERRPELVEGRKQKQIPFKESNRFYRGRIMDLLREGEWPQKKLLNELTKTYDKSEAFFVEIIKGLEKDGLLLSKKNLLVLPD